jgi:hypothetical protein
LKSFIIFALCIIPYICLGQNMDSVRKIAQTQNVRIVAVSYNKEHKKLTDVGYGIVLNGKYLATCYHLVSPEDTSYKLHHVFLTYNGRYEHDLYKYDSIALIKDFKTKRNQYNFSKHVYDPLDRSTDFVVLKLANKYKMVKYSFVSDTIKSLQSVYSFGNINVNNVIMSGFQDGIFLLKYFEYSNKSTFYYCYLSTHTNGFSGTSLYNKKGDIIGMVQFNMPLLPMSLLNQWRFKHVISTKQYYQIIDYYKRGITLQFAIDYNFLIRKYLNGYL